MSIPTRSLRRVLAPATCTRSTGAATTTAVVAVAWLAGCAAPSFSRQAADEQAARTAAVAAVTQAPTLAEQGGHDVAGGHADVQRRAAEQRAGVVLRRSPRAWVAGTSVPYSGEQLPSVFTEPLRLNFPDRPSVKTMAERLTTLSGVPMRVKADVMADPGGGGVRVAALAGAGAAMAGPLALREAGVHAVPMEWSGSLADYLTHVTDLLGLSWEYRDGAVVIERFRTEYFELGVFDGESAYSLGMTGADAGTGGSGGAAGTSTSSASSDVSDKGRTNAAESVIKAVKQITKDVPGSDVLRAEGSGRLVVTTSREAMSKVRDFIRSEHAAMLRQAQVQFDIYSVRTGLADERGVNWELVLRSLSRAFGANVSTPVSLTGSATGGVNFTVLDSGSAPGSDTARRFGGSQAVLALLNQFGHSSEHRPVSLLGLNRQWARKASLSSQAYVSETIPGVATSVGAGAPGLKTATVTTGDRYVAMPVVLDNGAVLLKFGIGLSSLVQIANFTSGSGSTQQTVQTPETNAVIDQAAVVLKAGQVLAITGLSRVVATERRRSLGEDSPIGLGGSRTIEREREDFVIFVRPTLL
jgi:type IVB pilus formation R64 PilN family outer membrane protein